MADHSPTGPVETGAQMDYPEHEKTYKTFIALAKYCTIACVALLVAMAFGFFTTAGFFSATILFIVVIGVLSFALRDVPTHIT
ncbi:aa3-type cytochrome c oxidase subunit IV [Mesorhizobium marinum]|uniref:Aa3-type cytochrome c oxidase subunit IV n=1 Tax=Mesorhizobium marinum TaxID=3228790 RepID=A0ABV3QY74_9HYPH